MMPPVHPSQNAAIIRWLSTRVRNFCIIVLLIGSLLPPYVPKAALAPPEVQAGSHQFLLVEDGFLMKSSSLTQQGSRRAYAEGSYHTVKDGDSIGKLARKYDIHENTIIWANKLNRDAPLQPGQEVLILPVDGVLHTVARGQTLSWIADLYDVVPNEIRETNKIDGSFILAGQELIIPGGSPLIDKPKQQIAAAPAPDPGDEPVAADPPPPTPTPVAPPPVQLGSQPGVEYTPEPTYGVLQKPCSRICFITQYYHAGHFALDMQERGGGPIYASEAGTVTRADYGWNGGYGNVLQIDHGNGLETLYAHNKKLLVKEGDYVQRGQKIADMGNSGLVYGATGIHVHYEVRVRGVKKNPLLYIQ